MAADDWYAIFQLAVWAALLALWGWEGMPQPSGAHRPSRRSADFCLGLLGVLELAAGMLLTAEMPRLFVASLGLLGLALWACSHFRGRFRQAEWGCLLACVALLLAYLFYPPYFERRRYCSSRTPNLPQLSARMVLRELDQLADTATYPAGVLDEHHPFCLAHPEVAKRLRPAWVRRSRWHTCFTGVWRRETLPPPYFQAGTWGDNLPRLRKYYE